MPTAAARPVGQIAQHDADTLLTDASDGMGIGGARRICLGAFQFDGSKMNTDESCPMAMNLRAATREAKLIEFTGVRSPLPETVRVRTASGSVSYTHLTLPTILLV